MITYTEIHLRMCLNQAIYDLSTYDLLECDNEDRAEIRRLRAYIQKKIRELKGLKAEHILNREQTEFLTDLKKKFGNFTKREQTHRRYLEEKKEESDIKFMCEDLNERWAILN